MQENVILSAIFFDGKKMHQLKNVLDNKEYMHWYNLANDYFRDYIDEINETAAYLYFDMSKKPVPKLENMSAELGIKLRDAGLF